MKETGDAAAGDILSPKKAWVDGIEVTGTMATQTLSDANDTVNAGYYAGTTLSAVDADLDVANIKSGITIFGKAGTFVAGALPDTGQTTSYDVEDDADYNPGATQQSHTDNGNGTVTDNRTGLMWKKCSEPDTTTGCGGAHNAYSWTSALAQCAGLTYPAGSYADWRLPNALELFTIVKQEGAAPFIDQTAFPGTVSGYYWTSTTYVPSTTGAMSVYFVSGFVLNVSKTNVNYVRCVRAGP